ncbi:MAG: tetratricopeptide repeat protein, partial [Phycisphaerae bacterium]
MLSGPIEPSRRRDALLALICLICALVCYANSLGNAFCEDDLPIIVQNPLVTQPGGWGRLWLTDYWQVKATAVLDRDLLYRPVALLSYRINHLLGGLRPAGYHLVNVLLHGLVTVLVYRLGRRLTGSGTAAVAAGVLFAVLPIHSEAVDNVVGRAELLAALFVLGAIELFATGRRWGIVAGSICAFAACASKESGLSVMVLVPLLDRCPRLGCSEPRTSVRAAVQVASSHSSLRLSPFAFRYVGLVVALAVYLTLRYVALGGALYQPVTLSKSVNVLVDAGAWERVCGALQLWGMYWAKTAWPAVLCLDYSVHAVEPATSLLNGRALTGLIVLLVLAGSAVWAWRRGFALPLVLTVCLLIAYLPVSNTAVLVKTYFAERLWYLPSIWVALLAGLLLARATGVAASPLAFAIRNLPFAFRLSTFAFRLSTLTFFLLMVVWASWSRCWQRNVEWRDQRTVYAAAYRDHPEAVRVLLGYGQVLIAAGELEPGIALLKEALLIDLGLIDAHRALGMAYLQQGDPTRALEHLQLADAQVPGHPPTQRLLERARVLVAQSAGQGVSRAEAAVAADPDNVDALVGLADRLSEAGKLDEACSALRAGAERFAGSARFHHRLAVALVMTGRQDEAVGAYRRAIALDDANALLK